MRAVVVDSHGGPDRLRVADVVTPSPLAGQVLVRLKVSGVNYLDVYQRSGAAAVPFVAGVEGVGVIESLGESVQHLTVGMRVGWFSGGQGSFADYAVVQADKAVPLPDDIDDLVAVALLMQGVTAHYLATDAYAVQPGDAALVHAAAGGVGSLLTQIARLRGARVLGTASDAKAEVARGFGVEQVLPYDHFAEAARNLTGGEGVAVAYDGVGATTFEGSLSALRTRGTLVLYGAASGPVPPFDLARLAPAGSVYITRPTVVHYTRTASEIRSRTEELFAWHRSGGLSVPPVHASPIGDIVSVFEALEGRRTSGKLALTHD